MPIYLEPPRHNPGGPDGQGWNRLSMNAHMGTGLGQCALQPRRYVTLWQSARNTVHAKFADGYGSCTRAGDCNTCPIFTAKRLTMESDANWLLVRVKEVWSESGEFIGERPYVMNRPDGGWSHGSVPWSWADLLRLDGWTVGRRYTDEHSECFTLHKFNQGAADGMPSPCPHKLVDWRSCKDCSARHEPGPVDSGQPVSDPRVAQTEFADLLAAWAAV